MAKKILVVDDEPAIVMMIKTRLTRAGYESVEAGSGSEALQQARSERPDLILLDVMMPPPNGYQVCRMLKDDPEFKSVPIILLTAKGSETDKFWGSEAGADRYLTKPYNAQELMGVVAELLGDTAERIFGQGEERP